MDRRPRNDDVDHNIPQSNSPNSDDNDDDDQGDNQHQNLMDHDRSFDIDGSNRGDHGSPDFPNIDEDHHWMSDVLPMNDGRTDDGEDDDNLLRSLFNVPTVYGGEEDTTTFSPISSSEEQQQPTTSQSHGTSNDGFSLDRMTPLSDNPVHQHHNTSSGETYPNDRRDRSERHSSNRRPNSNRVHQPDSFIRRRGRLPFVIRTALIFIGGIIPLLLEMCCLRETLSQFLDCEHSWIRLQTKFNPTLLKYDVVVRVPKDLIDHAILSAKDGLCVSKANTLGTVNLHNEEIRVAKDGTTISDHETTLKRVRQNSSARTFLEGSIRRAYHSSMEDQHYDSMFPSPLWPYDPESPQTYELFAPLKRFQLVLVLTGKRLGNDRSGKTIDQALQSSSYVTNVRDDIEGRVGMNGLPEVRGTSSTTTVDRNDHRGFGDDDVERMIEKKSIGIKEVVKIKGTDYYSHEIHRLIDQHSSHIKEGDEPIACPIQLTFALCESKTFLQALRDPYHICNSLIVDEETINMQNINTNSWSDYLGWTFLGRQNLSRFWSSGESIPLNASTVTTRDINRLRGAATSDVSSLLDEYQIPQRNDTTTVNDHGSPSFRRSTAMFHDLFASQSKCMKSSYRMFDGCARTETSSLNKIHQHTSSNSDHILHDGTRRRTGRCRTSARPIALDRIKNSSLPIALFIASELSDDVTPSFLLRFLGVMFVFGRWICAEMRVVIEMFIAPAFIPPEVFGWYTLFSFRRFRAVWSDGVRCISKVLRLIGTMMLSGFTLLCDSVAMVEDCLIHTFLLKTPMSYLFLPSSDNNSNPDVGYGSTAQAPPNHNDAVGNNNNSDEDDGNAIPQFASTEELEMDQQSIALHAIWRTLNFSLHYLWSAIAILCLQCLTIDGAAIRWTANGNCYLNLSELFVAQQLAWFAWALVIAVIHCQGGSSPSSNSPNLYSTARRHQTLPTPPRRLPSPIVLNFLTSDGSMATFIQTFVAGLWYVLGAYAVVALVCLYTWGIMRASIWPVGFYMVSLLAETFVRAFFGLEASTLPFESVHWRRHSNRRRFHHPTTAHQDNQIPLEQELVDLTTTLPISFRLTRSASTEIQEEELLWREERRNNAYGTSTNNTTHETPIIRPSPSVGSISINEFIERLTDRVAGLEFIGTSAWMRAAQPSHHYHHRNHFGYSETQSIAGGENGRFMKLFIVEKLGMNYFKIVDPAVFKLDDEHLETHNTRHQYGENHSTPPPTTNEPEESSTFNKCATEAKEAFCDQFNEPQRWQEEDDNSPCYICMCSSDAVNLLLPCMHSGICFGCGRSILSNAILSRGRVAAKCPLCRSSVNAMGQLEHHPSFSLGKHDYSINRPQSTGTATSLSMSCEHQQNDVDHQSANDLPQHVHSASSPYRLLRVVLVLRPITQ